MNRIIKGRTGICVETIELRQRLDIDLLELGRRLMEIKEKKLWQGAWDSFVEYLDDLKVNENTAYKIIRIYQLFIVECKLSPARVAKVGGWTLAETLPAIKTTRDAMKWFDIASQMRNRTDLRRTLHEEKKGVNMMTCAHEDTYTIKICRDCGVRFQEFSEDVNKKDCEISNKILSLQS
jgi:hypothetical protein